MDLHTLLVWFGLIFVYEGPYQGAIVKFQMNIPQEYPLAPPTILLIHELFHPLIHMSNAVSLAHAFPTWHQFHHSIYHVLLAFKDIFSTRLLQSLQSQPPQYCPDKQAHKILSADWSSYLDMCRKAVALITDKEILLDNLPPSNPIRIFDLPDGQFEELKRELYSKSVISLKSKDYSSESNGKGGIVRVLSGLGKLILG